MDVYTQGGLADLIKLQNYGDAARQTYIIQPDLPPTLHPSTHFLVTERQVKSSPPSHGRSHDSPAEVAAVMRSISGGAAATRPGWLQAALHSPLHAAQASLPDYGPLRSPVFCLRCRQEWALGWMDCVLVLAYRRAFICKCACIHTQCKHILQLFLYIPKIVCIYAYAKTYMHTYRKSETGR